MNKIVIDLSKPMPAGNDCLPHAAMALGSVRGSGVRPAQGMVWRLIIEQQGDQWCLYRMDNGGGFVGDSWHPTKDDALKQARKEFGID
ncbi:MAG: hypothetical protein ACREJC_13040 [Tepidisphaeraceae bacterium]